MSFNLQGTLRRLKPQKRVTPLARRADSELTFADAVSSAGPALLLDTTVYIDTLKDRLPPEVEALLAARQINHSAIALAELSHPLGRLDPAHPETPAVVDAIQQVILSISAHRLAAPSIQAMAEAGIVTGIIARLRGATKADHRSLLNDVLLFLQALESGFWLLSCNVSDLDLIGQVVPSGRVLFYRQRS